MYLNVHEVISRLPRFHCTTGCYQPIPKQLLFLSVELSRHLIS